MGSLIPTTEFQQIQNFKTEPPDMMLDCLPSVSSSISYFSSSISPTSTESSDTTTTSNSIKQSDNICAVCGDIATGLHYFTPSCNGCKTFFRRCVVNGRKFVCRNDGKCIFDKNKRCSCRACRFQKCVDAGMNPQAIQYTPSANLTLSIARKRFTKNMKQNKNQENNNDTKNYIKYDPFNKSIHNQILHSIGYVLRIEEKHYRLRNSTYDPYDNTSTLLDHLSRKCVYSDSEKYQIVEKWPKRPLIDCDKYELKKRGFKFWYFIDIILGIDYIKTFSFYNELSTEDKLAWARSTSLATTLLSSSYYSFLQKSDVVLYPDGSVPFQVKNQEELIELEKKFRYAVISNVQALKMDQIQYTLSRAIVILNDASPSMSQDARELISEERNKYSIALLRYLQNKLGTEEGTKIFGETICFITGLYRRTELNKAYYAYRQFVACNSNIQSIFMAQLLLDFK